jgi:sarcosine oxidase subunit beta
MGSKGINDVLGQIIVIGAGSTGASTAYHLAKMGQKVALIDKGKPSSGMTSRSTALVRNHYSNQIVVRMAHYSLGVLRNFDSIGQSGFVNCGMLFLGNKESRNALDSVLPILKSEGVKNERLESKEAMNRFDGLKLEDDEFVDLESDGGYADPVLTANSYVSKARDLGVEILSDVEVKRLSLDSNNRIEAVETRAGERIRCSKAVLCTNVWTNNLLIASGLKENIFPLWAATHPVVILRRPIGYEGLKPCVADLPNKVYYKPEGRSLFFAGSLDPLFDSKMADPMSSSNDVSFEFVDSISNAIANRIPSMSESVFHSSYTGMYDMTPDQHPIIDELSEIGFSEVYCCVGLSGHGFKLCPALGLMTAEMVCEKDNPEFDWDLFSLDRFKGGKLFSSKYSSVNTIA